MVNKDRVCKECGHLTLENKCEICGSTKLGDRFKGKIVVFDVKHSVLAEKLGIKQPGRYALKYN